MSKKKGLHPIAHAQIGQIIHLQDPKTGESLPEPFLVVAVETRVNDRQKVLDAEHFGLATERRQVFLVSLDTGLARKLPKLSVVGNLTKLTLRDVRPELQDIPTLSLQLPDSRIRVDMVYGDNLETETWDLADHPEMLAHLQALANSGTRLRRVLTQAEVSEEDQQRARWKAEVASGRTEMSFSQYKDKELAANL